MSFSSIIRRMDTGIGNPIFHASFSGIKVKVDGKTLNEITKLPRSKPYQLYPDATIAVQTAKKNGFKTSIVTTMAHFKFEETIQPIKKYFDFIMTGHEAGCDKSNPKMYLKVAR